MKSTRALAVMAVLLAAALVTACTGTSESRVESTAPQVAPNAYGGGAGFATKESLAGDAVVSQDGVADDRFLGAGEAAGAISAGPMVIRNATVDLRVKSVDRALASLRTIVGSHDGEITELSASAGNGGVVPLDASGASDEPQYASVVVRVAADKLSALVEALGELGTVVSQSESASDVTEQAIDMEARLKNLRAEEARLRSFLDRTQKVSELLQVEAELSRVRGEIESMDAQLTYLKRQVARATLTVTLSEPGSVAGPESPWYRLRQALSRGVQGAIGVVEMLVTFAIASLPLIVMGVLIAWLVTVLVRRRNRRRGLVPEQPVDSDTPEEETL